MEAVHDAERLKELQALPLERKILITQTRLIEFFAYCERNGYEPVISLSGKDSTVLLHIARQIKPDIKAVFSDTGLEYEAVRKLARKNGAEIIRPKMMFTEVLTTYGYPLVSKEVSEAIYYARRIRNGSKPPQKRAELCGLREREETNRAARAAKELPPRESAPTNPRWDLHGRPNPDPEHPWKTPKNMGRNGETEGRPQRDEEIAVRKLLHGTYPTSEVVRRRRDLHGIHQKDDRVDVGGTHD